MKRSAQRTGDDGLPWGHIDAETGAWIRLPKVPAQLDQAAAV